MLVVSRDWPLAHCCAVVGAIGCDGGAIRHGCVLLLPRPALKIGMGGWLSSQCRQVPTESTRAGESRERAGPLNTL